MAIAYLGLTVDDFNDLTPKEFDEALKAWYKLKNQESQTNIRVQYEVARFLAVQIWNSAGKMLKSDIKSPKEFFPFPWDNEDQEEGHVKESGKQSIDEMKMQFYLIAQAFKGNKELKTKPKK